MPHKSRILIGYLRGDREVPITPKRPTRKKMTLCPYVVKKKRFVWDLLLIAAMCGRHTLRLSIGVSGLPWIHTQVLKYHIIYDTFYLVTITVKLLLVGS